MNTPLYAIGYIKGNDVIFKCGTKSIRFEKYGPIPHLNVPDSKQTISYNGKAYRTIKNDKNKTKQSCQTS